MESYQLRYLQILEAANRQYAIDEAAAKAKERGRKLKNSRAKGTKLAPFSNASERSRYGRQ